MAREIKFRARRSDNGEWVYGFWYKGHRFDDAVKEVPLGNCRLFDCIITPDGIIFDVDPNTLGELTGLHDKNGKEIYEGDILKVICSCGHIENMPVVWGYSGWEVKQKWQHYFTSEKSWFEHMEVICNIYENPELLGS